MAKEAIINQSNSFFFFLLKKITSCISLAIYDLDNQLPVFSSKRGIFACHADIANCSCYDIGSGGYR